MTPPESWRRLTGVGSTRWLASDSVSALVIAIAVIEDLNDFLRRVRLQHVVDGSLRESVAQWFGIEERTTRTAKVVKLKPTDRFFFLLAASRAFQTDDGGVEWSAWTQGTDGICFRGAEVFPGEIVEECHLDLANTEVTGSRHKQPSPITSPESGGG